MVRHASSRLVRARACPSPSISSCALASYTGALLSFYGLAIGFENLWAALIIAVPPTIAFFIRMRVEEAVLRDAFPGEYPDYERATKRLVPFIY